MSNYTYSLNDRTITIRYQGNEINYNLLTEPYCKKCSYPISTEDCRWHHSDMMDRTYAIGLYYPTRRNIQDMLSEHIRNLKSEVIYAEPLGYAMAILINERYKELAEIDYVVPIPKHQVEYKYDNNQRREYNQAEELAKIICNKINKPIINNLLNKNKSWSQRNRNWYDRWSIPDDVYTINNNIVSEVKGKNILLIDDVRTSGATASKCAEILKEAGANKVYLFVAGRDVGDQETLT